MIQAPTTANKANAPKIPPNQAYCIPEQDHATELEAVLHQIGMAELTPDSISCPGTCTFIPHRPVTRFIGLFVDEPFGQQDDTRSTRHMGMNVTHMRTVPNAVNLLGTRQFSSSASKKRRLPRAHRLTKAHH